MGRKKICLFICGPLPDFPPGKLERWLRQIPELNIIADVEPVLVFEQPSADVTPAVWLKLAGVIAERAARYNGFVVIHGIDNLLFTAAAMSFLMQHFNRPVIFTSGGLVPPASRDVEIKANLINAIQVATHDFSEVCLMLGNRLLRANQAIYVEQESLGSFQAPLQSVLGRIDFSIRIFEADAGKRRGQARLATKLNENIEVVDWTPACSVELIAGRSAQREGLIINAGDYRTLPEALVSLAKQVVAAVPVVIWAPKVTDSALASSPVMLINAMTWPATLTKFMWALGTQQRGKQLTALMNRSIAGEFIS